MKSYLLEKTSHHYIPKETTVLRITWRNNGIWNDETLRCSPDLMWFDSAVTCLGGRTVLLWWALFFSPFFGYQCSLLRSCLSFTSIEMLILFLRTSAEYQRFRNFRKRGVRFLLLPNRKTLITAIYQAFFMCSYDLFLSTNILSITPQNLNFCRV